MLLCSRIPWMRPHDEPCRHRLQAAATRREAAQSSCPASRTCGCSCSSRRFSSPATSRSTWSRRTQNRVALPAVPGAPGSPRRGLQHARLATEFLGRGALRSGVPRGRLPSGTDNAFMTISFGLVFLVSKVFEWVKQIRMGFTFTTNEFFSALLFLDCDPLHTPVDRLHRAGHRRLSVVESGPAIPAARRNVCNLLAHR